MVNERVFIGMGSNQGMREQQLAVARTHLSNWCGQLVQASPLYASAAWGFEGRPFLNQAVEIRTELHPLELMERLLHIETLAGRRRVTGGYADRTLDLDLLYFGRRVLRVPALHLPHPLLTERRFVLQPMAAIAPEFRDPRDGRSVQTLLERCTDQSAGAWH